MAEGRALRRHGNRSGIIYLGCLVPTLSWKQGTWDSASALYCFPIASFPFPGKRGHSFLWPIFPARLQLFAGFRVYGIRKRVAVMSHYELRCRECGRTWGNQPRSICDDCFSPLEITYDYDALKASVSREVISRRAPNMWRYSELLFFP